MSLHPVFRQDFDAIIAASAARLKKLAGGSILITGACGFIGSDLVDPLAYCNDTLFAANKCKIYGADNFVVGSHARMQHLKDRFDVETWQWDITSQINSPPHVDWLINCASIASPAVYRDRPLDTMRVNAIGTWNMLELAELSRVKGMLQLSSSEVYGDASAIPTPETFVGAVPPLGPRSSYDVSKLFGETLAMLHASANRVPVKIARPFNIYGPGHQSDGRIIPEIMSAIREDREFAIHGDGSATRSYCYVSDAVVQLLAILIDGIPGEAYNVGSLDPDLSVQSLLTVANAVFDGRPRVRIAGDAVLTKDQPSRRRPDIGKMLALGNIPMQFVHLPEGLRRVYESEEK